MNAALQNPQATAFIERLVRIVGAVHVLTGTDVTAYATDIYRCRALPLAVVQPGTVEELQSVVRTTTEADIAIVARGGGASYTDAYLPTRTDTILIDTTRLNRIVELNQEDAYVTVETGTTWANLKAALDPLGLRTPFFGPFSGIAATIGGSLSQHTISHGSGMHGISAQSLLTLEVVIADGALLRTGSAARVSTAQPATPHSRWFGPDLAGLFTGDCGSFGIKARITLPLLKQMSAFECASFGFADFSSLSKAMRAAALERLDDEHFAIDAKLVAGQIARQDRLSSFAAIAALWKSAPSPFAAIKQLLRSGWAGKRALREHAYLLHYTVEGVAAEDARLRNDRLRTLMDQHGGDEIANTMPAFVRGMPFPPLFSALGPKGELWIPVHGVLAHSTVAACHAAVHQLFEERSADMQRLGVWYAGMFIAVGSSSLLYELALYWPGALSVYHETYIPKDYLAQLPRHSETTPETAAFVDCLKNDLVAIFDRFGATHFQIGKFYPYAQVIAPESLHLLRAIKQAVDPKGLLNPDALGL